MRTCRVIVDPGRLVSLADEFVRLCEQWNDASAEFSAIFQMDAEHLLDARHATWILGEYREFTEDERRRTIADIDEGVSTGGCGIPYLRVKPDGSVEANLAYAIRSSLRPGRVYFVVVDSGSDLKTILREDTVLWSRRNDRAALADAYEIGKEKGLYDDGESERIESMLDGFADWGTDVAGIAQSNGAGEAWRSAAR